MDVFHDLDQLAIFLTAVETCDWHTIAELPRKREHLIIHDQRTTQVNTVQDVQVLVVRLLALVRYILAMLAEVSVLDERARWVDLVNDRIGVPIEASCEDGDFIVSVGRTEALE